MRSYNLLKQLSKKHEITLFCYIREDEERQYIPKLKKYCSKVVVIKRRKAWSPLNILLAMLTPYPFLVAIYLSPSFRRSVLKELENHKYDLIHCENNYVMTNVPATNLPIILIDQTIEYLVYQHFVDNYKLPFIRPILNIDVYKLKFWERYFWRKAHKVVAVSQADKNEMLRSESGLEVDLVPNGVDVEFFIPKKSWSSKSPKILFVSNFKWLQNTEAAQILVQEIFPIVKQKIPSAKLWIVGQHVPDSIMSLRSKEVIVDNLKQSDVETIRKAYHEAAVFVAPLRGPGGTRLKNLAAMASRLPIVTTSIGAEGIGIRNGKEALIRDTNKDIARAVIKLLENPKLARYLSQNARKLAVNKYSWEKMAQKLDNVYLDAVRKR